MHWKVKCCCESDSLWANYQLSAAVTSRGCTDSGSCTLPSSHAREHASVLQSNTLDITRLASAAFCLFCVRSRWIGCNGSNFETFFKFYFVHASHCIDPPPRHDPQNHTTANLWQQKTEKTFETSEPSNEHQECLVPRDRLMYKKPSPCLWLAFSLGGGFTHTNIHICSTILPSFWMHKKRSNNSSTQYSIP